MLVRRSPICPVENFFYKRALVRMNFSHGSYEYHQSVIDNTRKMVAGEVLADSPKNLPENVVFS
jgi:hypothetical protein